MLQDPNVERVIKNYTEPLRKKIRIMQIELEALKKQCVKDFVISRLLKLKRYETSTGAGWEGSGDVWTELDEDENGELVKFEDIEELIKDLTSS